MYINDMMYVIYPFGHRTSHNDEKTVRVTALSQVNDLTVVDSR